MGLTINNQKVQTAANGTADFVGGVGSNFCSSTWQSENMVYGNLMRENGKVKHIYNEAGYVDIDEAAGTYCYNFYVRDYLGSVRAVVGANGELWQFNDYHVTGIPSSQFGQLNADDHLHTGKEYNAFNGLHMYDNNARTQDPILGRFTSPDPLAEKYPNLSPYAHCMNNPLKYVDPDGKQSFEVYNEIRTERIKLLTAPGNEYIEALKSNNADDVIVSNATIATTSGIVGLGSVIGKAVQLIQRIVANNENNGTIYEVP
ncbi:MAG: RHS repeat-associated core domain-containing protein [Muribaculaceae bacterium]